MPEKLIVTPSRSILACARLLVAMLLGADAHAQTTNPVRRRRRAAPPSIRCARGWKRNWPRSTAAAAATRPRTSRSAATRMPLPGSRRELDRVTSQAKRMGCDSSGLLLAVQWPVARNAVRSTTKFSRCAQTSTRSRLISSACAAAASAAATAKTSAARFCWRSRRIIAARNTPPPCSSSNNRDPAIS